MKGRNRSEEGRVEPAINVTPDLSNDQVGGREKKKDEDNEWDDNNNW